MRRQGEPTATVAGDIEGSEAIIRSGIAQDTFSKGLATLGLGVARSQWLRGFGIPMPLVENNQHVYGIVFSVRATIRYSITQRVREVKRAQELLEKRKTVFNRRRPAARWRGFLHLATVAQHDLQAGQTLR